MVEMRQYEMKNPEPKIKFKNRLFHVYIGADRKYPILTTNRQDDASLLYQTLFSKWLIGFYLKYFNEAEQNFVSSYFIKQNKLPWFSEIAGQVRTFSVREKITFEETADFLMFTIGNPLRSIVADRCFRKADQDFINLIWQIHHDSKTLISLFKSPMINYADLNSTKISIQSLNFN